MKEITLYGAGGHCFAIVELIKSLQHYNPIQVLDDNPVRKEILGVSVYKTNTKLISQHIAISIGDNPNRKKIAQKYNKHHFPTLVHSSVVQYPSIQIGRGTHVLPGAVLDASVSVGEFCIVNNNATVSHNAIVNDYCHIAINAVISGGVSIGTGSLIGAGSIILPEIKIGKWAIVGAGAVVTKNVPDYAVVYGNPAKVIRYNK